MGSLSWHSSQVRPVIGWSSLQVLYHHYPSTFCRQNKLSVESFVAGLVSQSYLWKPCLVTEDAQFRLCIPHYYELLLGSSFVNWWSSHCTRFPHSLPNALPTIPVISPCTLFLYPSHPWFFLFSSQSAPGHPWNLFYFLFPWRVMCPSCLEPFLLLSLSESKLRLSLKDFRFLFFVLPLYGHI